MNMTEWLEHRSQPEPNSGCCIWLGALRRGYGLITVAGLQIPTHRLAWELANGRIPDNLWVLHHCDTPACINPNHLFLGTALDNAKDCKAKGRNIPDILRGVARRHAKLTNAQVLEIRAAVGTRAEIGRAYGVSAETIRKIKQREIRKYI